MESSPYTPGAGTLPLVLAGRDRLLHRLMLGLNDVATAGRSRTQDVILIGPRGVGKTVAVSVYGDQARAGGFEVVNLQAVSGRTGLVTSLLERAAGGIACQSGPWTRAKHAFDRHRQRQPRYRRCERRHRDTPGNTHPSTRPRHPG